MNKIDTKIFSNIDSRIIPKDYLYKREKILIGLLCSSIVILFYSVHLFDRIEATTFDARSKFSANQVTSDDIILIDIAEDSISAIGRWPWKRQWHATMISILTEFDVSGIFYDVIFSEPSTLNQDLAMREAIRQSERVYLPIVFHFDNELRKIRYASTPIEMFAKHAKGVGHVNIMPDGDGILRRVPLYLRNQNAYTPQLAYIMAKDFLHARESVRVFDEKIVLKSEEREIKIPLDKGSAMILRWAGKWKDTFKHYSFIDLIKDYNDYRKEGAISEKLLALKGKLCLIGLTVHGLYDIKPIPIENTYPAIGINATIISNIIEARFVTPVSDACNYLLILFMGLLASMIIVHTRAVPGLLFTALLSILYSCVIFVLFKWTGILAVLFYPILACALIFISITFYGEICALVDRKELFNLATVDELTSLYNSRYFKEQLRKEFDKSGKRRRRDLALIMSDIDHFKKFNDTYGHQVGDYVLKEVARIYQGESRTHDIACRYGGEEFIMILPDTDEKDAYILAERIRKKVESSSFEMNNKKFHVTISLGVAGIKNEKEEAALIKNVDTALYQAKKRGRNQTVS